MQDTPLLQIKHLSKSFGSHDVVKSVSLDVHSGDCLALVGHNGAGKTTIFKMILKLLRPSFGEVLIHGKEPCDTTAVGFLPESVSFQKALTGLELLHFFARMRGVGSETDFNQLLEKVDLLDAGNQRIGTYSKGMRQRLGLAQALIGKPELLILDEPTSGLDPSSRRRFYALLDELRAAGSTILLSTHALTEVESYTNQVAILRSGELLARGPIQSLASKANLPVRIHVRLKETVAADVNLLSNKEIHIEQGLDKNWLKIAVPESLKLSVLHELSSQTSVVEDINVYEPTLDDIYAYYQIRDEESSSEDGLLQDDIENNVMPFPATKIKGGVK